MNNLYADLDPGIRDVVRLLRDHGWNTTCSCQGGVGHSYQHPSVEIDLSSLDDVERLALFLVEHEKEHGHRTFHIDATVRCPSDGMWDRHAIVIFGTVLPRADPNEQAG